MPEPQRRLILSNGESYARDIDKPGHSRPTERPRPYEQARELVKRDLTETLTQFGAMSARKKYDDEAVFCLRIHPDFIAKSYDPQGIFGLVRDLENVGSRKYKIPAAQVAPTQRIKRALENHIAEVTGRAVFVRSNDAGFRRLLRALDQAEGTLSNAFKHEIQSVERFNTLQADEQLEGFPANWRQGRVELVLHPTLQSEEVQYNFLLQLFRGHNLNWGTTKVVPYTAGPVFISCHLTKAALSELAGANPLRTAHPLIFRRLEDLRGVPGFAAPPPPQVKTRSAIKIGMFDGGVAANLPHLRDYVEQDEALAIKTKPNAMGLAHGTAVAGAILYGALNDKDPKQPLPTPNVSVVSVRCLPLLNPKDPDLYDAIDVIEAAVPVRTDVGFWGISLGPRGPYCEDTISRFTYALDLLAFTYKVGFSIAAGNDGEAGEDLDRIQAPADMVNGLGVGAYTVRDGRVVHAPYSCRGAGRECAKIKPDLSAFGGCSLTPFHLLSTNGGEKVLSYGTSFAAPLVAALGGQTSGTMERGTALLARALLLHRAKHPDGDPDYLLGHGLLPDSLDEVLRCGNKEVTIIFQGAISPKKTKKLRLLLPPDILTEGKVAVTWTVACLPPVDPNHPADYTCLCVEDVFYPNSNVFSLSKKLPNGKIKSKKLNTKRDAAEIQTLLSQGWRKSNFPSTDSGNEYLTEEERRAQCKWEPIVRRTKIKQAGSLDDPFLTIHATPRHAATEHLDYAVIVTISAPKYSGDLYDAVIRRFTNLQPVRLRSETQLRVQI